jgi:hypothetical protein
MCRVISSRTTFQSYKTAASPFNFSNLHTQIKPPNFKIPQKPNYFHPNQTLPRTQYFIPQSWPEAKFSKPRSTTRARTRTSSSSSTMRSLPRTGRPTRASLSLKSSARSRSSSPTSKSTCFLPRNSANGSRLLSQLRFQVEEFFFP